MDNAYAERIKLMETLLERKTNAKVDEAVKKGRAELEEAVRRSQTELDEMRRKLAESDSHFANELRARDDELAQLREIESGLRSKLVEQASQAEKRVEETKSKCEEEKKSALNELAQKHSVKVNQLELDLVYERQRIDSLIFDLEQQKKTQTETMANYNEQLQVNEELATTVASLEHQVTDLQARLDETKKQAASAAEQPKTTKKENETIGTMEWEDDDDDHDEKSSVKTKSPREVSQNNLDEDENVNTQRFSILVVVFE